MTLHSGYAVMSGSTLKALQRDGADPRKPRLRRTRRLSEFQRSPGLKAKPAFLILREQPSTFC